MAMKVQMNGTGIVMDELGEGEHGDIQIIQGNDGFRSLRNKNLQQDDQPQLT